MMYDVLPIGTTEWKEVERLHRQNYPQHDRSREALKRKFRQCSEWPIFSIWWLGFASFVNILSIDEGVSAMCIEHWFFFEIFILRQVNSNYDMK